MPPELACEMARAGERLDLGDRVGARRIVRRVLDRAALELLAELADLVTDLGLGEEDLGTAAVRGALRWVPPTRVRQRPFPASGLAGLAGPRRTWPRDTRSGRPATRRGRDGGGEVSSYLATRVASTTPRSRAGGPTGYTIDYDRAALQRPQAAMCTGCHLETADVARGDGVCARTAAPTGSAVTRSWCGARPSSPRWCAADRGPAASCGGCGTPPTPPTGPPSPPGSPPTTLASPRPRATAAPRLPSPRPSHLTVTGPLRVAVGRWCRSASPARTRRARAS